MKLRFDAVRFVMDHGSPYHRAQVLAALGETAPPEFAEAIDALKALRDPKGRWPWRWDSRNPWGAGETARAAKLIIEIGQDEDGQVAQDTVDCFTRCQRVDGGWCNNPDLKSVIPKDWDWLSAADSSPSVTGEVLSCLATIGCDSRERISRARKFIRDSQRDDGGWPTYVGPRQNYSSDPAAFADVIAGLLDTGDEPRTAVIDRAVGAIRRQKPLWSEPAYNPLDTFLMLGWDPLNTEVDTCVTMLINKQRSDGGWNWFGDHPSDAGQTAYWIPKLILCGVTV